MPDPRIKRPKSLIQEPIQHISMHGICGEAPRVSYNFHNKFPIRIEFARNMSVSMTLDQFREFALDVSDVIEVMDSFILDKLK